MSSLFDKVAKDLQDGVLTLSERAAELFKTGTEALRGSMEMASTRAAHAAKLAKLKWELNVLQREIEKVFTALGGQTYELFVVDRLPELAQAAQEKFASLRALEQKLEDKEKEIEILTQSFSATTAQPDDLKNLRQDLEGAGGTIMQVHVSAQSSAAHRACGEIGFSHDLIIGALLRGEEIIMPSPETVLLPGDRVTLLGKKEAVQQAARLLGE